ncbi:hypothetical protein [Halovenus sp. HT40]|uniref:hypothetical protein n=1 Tax=Halovenus sp. HT40 TaxID=3126691 RepID=UPI00300F19F5
MTVERSRSYRGISVRAALGYLENVGGEQVDDQRVEGEGWSASLSSEKVEVGPSIRLTEVTVEFEGDSADLLDPVIEKFSQKAIRAGG